MKVVVLGAAGGVGRHAVEVAARRGHEVVAAARSLDGASTPPGATAVALDVRDADAVARALEGADAVLWCVGVTSRSGPDVGRASLPGVLAGAERAGATRLVSISGAGVTVPGDRKGLGARAVSALTKRLAKDLVADKEGEHALLAASGIGWTEVRAPRLVQREGTGRYTLGDVAPGATARPVAKADAALAMVDLLDPDQGAEGSPWYRRSPFVTAGESGGGRS